MTEVIFVDYYIVHILVQYRDLSALGYKIQYVLHFSQGQEEFFTAAKYKVASLSIEKLFVLKLAKTNSKSNAKTEP